MAGMEQNNLANLPEISLPWPLFLSATEQLTEGDGGLGSFRYSIRIDANATLADIRQVQQIADPSRTVLVFDAAAHSVIPAKLAPHVIQIELNAENQTMSSLLDLLDHFDTYGGLAFFIKLDEPGAQEAAIVLASIGVPTNLRFDRLGPGGGDVFLNVLDYFLHAKALKNAIEPYYSLIQSELHSGKNRPDVWMLNREKIGRHFHVSSTGSVTLSPRLAQEGVCFGSLSDGLDAWVKSEPYQKLARWPWILREHNAPCASCEVFKMCKGYFADYSSPDRADCEAEKAALLELSTAAVVLASATAPNTSPAGA